MANDLDLRIRINGENNARGPLNEVRDNLNGVSSAAANASRQASGTADAVSDIGNASEEAGGFIASLKNNLLGLAAVGAAAGAATFLFLKAAAEDAIALDLQMRKLQAVIKATGGAAGLTAKDIKNMFAGEANAAEFNAVAAQLLQFKSIGKDVFEQTLRLAADLTENGFGSLESSALKLGAALDSPGEGLSALADAGIKFTEVQTHVLQTLVDTGQQAEAQKLILKAVADEVGGLADAMSGGIGGANDKIDASFRQIRETIGATQLPALLLFKTMVADVAASLKDFIQNNYNADAASKPLAATVLFLGGGFATAALYVDRLGRGIGALAAKLTALATLDLSAITAIDEAFNADNAEAQEKLNASLAKYYELLNARPDDTSVATKDAVVASANSMSNAIGGLTQHYKELADAVALAADQQLAAVDDKTTQGLRDINNNYGADSAQQRDQAVTRVLIQAEQERTRIVKAATQERMALIDKAYQQEITAAKAAGNETAKLDKDWIDSKARALQAWQSQTRQSIDALIALEKKYRDAAIQADSDIVNHKRSTADLVKQLRDTGQTDPVANLSRLRGDAVLQKREVTDARKTGDIETELQAAKRLEQAYIDVAQKAKAAFDQGLIDDSTLNITIYDLQAAAKQVDDITARQGEQQKQAAGEVAAEIAKQQASLADVNGQMDALITKAKETLTINVDKSAIDAAKAAIDAIPSEKTVVIKTVTEGGAPAVTDQTVPGFASGTRLAGFGGGDKHPAMLESGEGVVNKYAMRNLDATLGAGFFDGVNAGANPIALLRQRFALHMSEGGRLNVNLPSINAAAAGGAGGTPINIHLPGGQTFGPFKGSGDSASALEAALHLEVIKRGRRTL